MLDIENLHVSVAGKKIIDGLSLKVEAGQVAAIMGPNGSGKSTLSYVIAGRPDYEVTEGSIKLDGVDLLEKDVSERAALGVFLVVPISVGDSRRRHHDLPQGGDQRPAQGA